MSEIIKSCTGMMYTRSIAAVAEDVHWESCERVGARYCLFQPELLGKRRGLKEKGIGGGIARVTSRHIYSKPFH